MSKHLDIRDRVKLQTLIEQNRGIRLSYVSKLLNVSTSTIYRELRNRRIYRKGKRERFLKMKGTTCSQYTRFPYVCNGCPKLSSCSNGIYLYDAYSADTQYQKTLRDSRKHPYLSASDLKKLDEKVSPLIKNHQSLYHILETDPSIPVSESTLRRYILDGRLSCMAMDLPMTIRFSTSKRKGYSRGKPIPVDVLNNRTYLDYLDYCATAKRVTLQLDLVIGKAKDKRVILTLFDPVSKFQWGILISRGAKPVNSYIERLIRLLQKNQCFFFDSILTDNGSEFQLLPTLETSFETGEFYFKTFYCDPYASYQKGGCERNHAIFRRLYAKGFSFDFLHQDELNLAFSQLNSLKRKSLGGRTPFEVFSSLYNIDPRILGISSISPSSIKI